MKRGGPIKPRSDKRAAIADERIAFVDRILRERVWCEACPTLWRYGVVFPPVLAGTRHRAHDVHEFVRRTQGSPIVPSQGLADDDVLAVCRRSHDWITRHPAEAVALGLARWGMRANPVVSRLPSALSDSTPKEGHGMEIVYIGSQPATLGGACVVNRVESDEGEVANVAPLNHVKFKSDGFAWGYLGSGPAELARCLLIDALGDRARCASCEGRGRVVWVDGAADGFRAAREGEEGEFVVSCHDCDGTGYGPIVERVYQSFRHEVVAGWPQNGGWEITRTEVVAYAEARMAELNAEDRA